MKYSKCWENFIAKISAFETIPVQNWNHYQLLGYVVSITKQEIKPDYKNNVNGWIKFNPSRYHLLENVRSTFRSFGKDPNKTKLFFDWVCSKHRKFDLKYCRREIGFYKLEQTKIVNKKLCRTELLPKHIAALFPEIEYEPTYGNLRCLERQLELAGINIDDRLATINTSSEALMLAKYV